MPGAPLAANAAFSAAALPHALGLRAALSDVEGAQERLLLRMLPSLRGSERGRKLGLERVGSLRALAERVPLSEWSDYEEASARIAKGEPGILTAEEVIRLVPTGGSSGGSKLVPYTRSHLSAFRRAVGPWLLDLASRDARVAAGPAYWSISPAVASPAPSAAVPVGFADDTEYLGRTGSMLARSLLAVPPQVRHAGDVETFRYLTLLFLVRERRLALVSVWHPSFLLLLLSPLARWIERLAADVSAGTLSPPRPLGVGLRDALGPSLRPDPQRGAELLRAASAARTTAGMAAAIWPRLALVSAWADGPAAPWAARLAEALPGVPIQPKGLLSTEGVVSVPLGEGDPVLAATSHVVELLDAGSRARPAHEASAGSPYEVVLTTSAGLVRYRTGDLVAVTGFRGAAPTLRFLGRSGGVSDRFGEKLAEPFVAGALASALASAGVAAQVAFVAYEESASGYVLFVEAEGAPDGALCEAALGLDSRLRADVHYSWARELGQLAAVSAFRVDRGGLETLFAVEAARGRRLGEVKLPALSPRSGFAELLEGRRVPSSASEPPVSSRA